MNLRKPFITGLILLLPIVLTLLIISFILNMLTTPFLGLVHSLLDHYNLFNQPFLFFSGSQILMFASKVTVLLLLIGITFLLGFFGRLLFMKYLFHWGDQLFRHIPMVNKIYKGTHEAVKTFFNSKGQSFSQVVLVPFPHSETHTLGLVSADHLPAESDAKFQDLVPVFVVGVPNPTFGFMLLFKKEQLIPVDMKVDEALKLLVSCGMIQSGKPQILTPISIQDIAAK